jgi:hypothetical protein
MPARLWLWAVAACASAGCASASLKTVEYDRHTGSYQEVKYTPYYRGELELVPGKVRVQVHAAIENRYGKQALTEPKDQWSKADFTIYFSNISEGQVVIGLRGILLMGRYFSDPYLAAPQDIVLVPQAVERLQFSGRAVDRFAKEMAVKIDFVHGGRKYSNDIVLRRLTAAEWKDQRPPLFNM